MTHPKPDEELLEILRDYYHEHGKSPSAKFITKSVYGVYGVSGTTIVRRFKTWNNALILANLELNKIPTGSTILPCINCGKDVKRVNSQITKSNGRSFCNHSCSASYSNKHKTTGTRRSKLERWIENLTVTTDVIFNKVHPEVKYELDIFIPSLKLAFEINGIFHYKPIFGDDKFITTCNTDEKKVKLCRKLGIKLIVIDVSEQKFTPESSQKYLDVIIQTINNTKVKK